MSRPLRVTMYNPTAKGGHPRYTNELLLALGALQADGVPLIEPEWIASRALDPAFKTETYPIRRLLDPLTSRDRFRSGFRWAIDRLRYYWRQARMLESWVRQHNPDGVVHMQEHSFLTGSYDAWRLKRTGAAVVATVHNIQWHAYPRWLPRPVADRLHALSLRPLDGLMVHSEELKSELGDLMGRKRPPIFVTPHGAWSPTGAAQDRTPARAADRHLLFFGIVGHYKGVHVLIKAMHLLPPDVRLTIAGNPVSEEYRMELRRMIGTLPEGRVRFIDRFIEEEEIPGLIRGSSIFVLPYVHFHAQSGVLHDAIAWERPVVGTDVGAVGPSIREWGIGEVVPPDDAKALADGILRMLEPDRFEQALKSLRRTREELSWERSAEKTLEAYRAVLAQRSGNSRT